MAEFFNVRSPALALAALRPLLSPISDWETVAAADALGRVLARDIRSPEDLPSFARSTMDGFSVRARDTFGASESMPALLEVVADIPTGTVSPVALGVGEAAGAYTGGTLAKGADAVVMVERTQPADERSIEVLRPVAPGENVIQPGEDVRAGEVVLKRGRRLRAQEVGGLMALGILEAPVLRRPRVGIISTGDEIVAPSETPSAGMVRDVNTYTIAARASECGAEALALGLIPDDYEAQLAAARDGIERTDALIFSAGSSLSVRDMTARVFNALGEPGVLIHGISIKPGKPTIVGMARGKPLFGLPGNPVSALTVFDLLVAPAVRVLSGESPEPAAEATVRAVLSADIPSESGREDFVPVKLSPGADGAVEASPVFGKSNLIFTLANADGVARVPAESGGLYAGEVVGVRLG